MKCCEEYTDALSAFADGELNETERDELLAHLEHCEGCREHLSELMILHTMFEELPELDAPQGFSERVLDRLHAGQRAKKRRRAWQGALAACFALVLISASAWLPLPASSSESAESANSGSAESAPSDTAAAAPSDSDSDGDSYSCVYTTVQKDGAQNGTALKDISEYDGSSAENGDRTADADGDYAIIALDTPDALEFLSACGMAVYAESDDYISYLVVPEAARELADLPDVPEAERAVLREADDLLIVEVTKPSAGIDDPVTEEPAGEEVSG